MASFRIRSVATDLDYATMISDTWFNLEVSRICAQVVHVFLRTGVKADRMANEGSILPR